MPATESRPPGKPRVVVVHVVGMPAPQGSKRHVGHGVMVESSRAVGPWREAVRAETQKAMEGLPPLAGPLVVRMRFFLPRPKGHYGRRGNVLPSAPLQHATRPDLDKLARAAGDGLNAGGAFTDDSQIFELILVKQYTNHDGATMAGATLVISETEG